MKDIADRIDGDFVIRDVAQLPTGNCVIYGAGKCGGEILSSVEHRPDINVLGFLDSNVDGEKDCLPIVKWVPDAKALHTAFKKPIDYILIASSFWRELVLPVHESGIQTLVFIQEPSLEQQLESGKRQRAGLYNNVLIQISSACNFKCTMCYSSDYYKMNRTMSRELYEKILMECKENSIECMSPVFGYGEPSMHPEFLDFMELAGSYGMKVSLVTNGLLFNKNLVQKLLDMGMHTLRFSFAGYDEESYYAFYGNQGQFSRIVENLRTANELLKEKAGNGVKISGQCASVNALDFASRTVNFLENIGISSENVLMCTSANKIETNTHGKTVDGTASPSALRHCPYLDGVGFFSDGKVTACPCFDLMAKMVIGDITTQKLNDIILSRRHETILENIEAGRKESMPVCSGCQAPNLLTLPA